MYKIIGNFYGDDINRECYTSDYAIDVFMAQVQRGMQYTDSYDASDAIDEAVNITKDVYTNDLPHYHELTEDMWLELSKE